MSGAGMIKVLPLPFNKSDGIKTNSCIGQLYSAIMATNDFDSNLLASSTEVIQSRATMDRLLHQRPCQPKDIKIRRDPLLVTRRKFI